MAQTASKKWLGIGLVVVVLVVADGINEVFPLQIVWVGLRLLGGPQHAIWQLYRIGGRLGALVFDAGGL